MSLQALPFYYGQFSHHSHPHISPSWANSFVSSKSEPYFTFVIPLLFSVLHLTAWWRSQLYYSGKIWRRLSCTTLGKSCIAPGDIVTASENSFSLNTTETYVFFFIHVEFVRYVYVLFWLELQQMHLHASYVIEIVFSSLRILGNTKSAVCTSLSSIVSASMLMY